MCYLVINHAVQNNIVKDRDSISSQTVILAGILYSRKENQYLEEVSSQAITKHYPFHNGNSPLESVCYPVTVW